MPKPKKLLFSVEEILKEIYSDSISETIEKLEEYGLVEVFNSKLKYLKTKLKRDDHSAINLNVFSISLLKSINDIVLKAGLKFTYPKIPFQLYSFYLNQN